MFALIAKYSDGSGTPEILRLYNLESKAEADLEMINKCYPAKHVLIVQCDDPSD